MAAQYNICHSITLVVSTAFPCFNISNLPDTMTRKNGQIELTKSFSPSSRKIGIQGMHTARNNWKSSECLWNDFTIVEKVIRLISRTWGGAVFSLVSDLLPWKRVVINNIRQNETVRQHNLQFLPMKVWDRQVTESIVDFNCDNPWWVHRINH
jgi:hypothetical protein